MSTDVRVGLLLPSRETAMMGEHDARGLVELARDAEAAGFDSVWTGDSPLARVRAEPLALLAAVAAATTRVSLGTAALLAALRDPLLGAYGAVTVDQLSRGRLVLGLGAGFPLPESEREFAAAGVPFEGRARRLDEVARRWRRMWRGEEPSTLPPARPGGPPLWLAAGAGPAVRRRVAAEYDGWLPYTPDVEGYRDAWREIELRARELGRTVTPGLYATVHLDPEPRRAEAALAEYVGAYYGRPLEQMRSIQAFFAGPPDACAEWLGRYVAAGARHVVLRIGTARPREQLDHVARDLLPLVRTASV